jgi:FtsH-binding integral membrane protein
MVALIGAAVGSFPYVYYQVMNWVVVIAALMVAWHAHKEKKDAIAWIFVAMAVVFNPIAPLYLRAGDWIVADIIAVLLFGLSFLVLSTKGQK